MTKQNCLVDDKGHPFPIVSTNQNQLIWKKEFKPKQKRKYGSKNAKKV